MSYLVCWIDRAGNHCWSLQPTIKSSVKASSLALSHGAKEIHVGLIMPAHDFREDK